MTDKTWYKDQTLNFILKSLPGNNFIATKNKFGHALIVSENKKYYHLHKKAFFMTFPVLFKEYCDDTGIRSIGDSINQEYLDIAIRNSCELLFTYQDNPDIIYKISQRKIYAMLQTKYPDMKFPEGSALLLKIYCSWYGLKREQDKTNTYKSSDNSGQCEQINEVTFSFPIELLEKCLFQ